MIYCPSCGTANRHGSRYCNECGVKFSPHMEVRCPHCGEMTTIQEPLCRACGQHMVSPGLPEPTEEIDLEEIGSETPDVAGDKGSTPAWLRGLPPPGGEKVRPSVEELEQVDLDRPLPPACLPPAPLPLPAAPRESGNPPRAGTPTAILGEGSRAGARRMPSDAQGGLPIAGFFSQPIPVPDRLPRRPEQRRPDSVTESPAAHLFREIVTPFPQEERATAACPRTPLLAHLPRWFLYAALIAAVTWPLVAENPWAWFAGLVRGADSGAPRSMTATPAVLDLYRQVGSLAAGAPVLLAFDYDPATAGEMDVVAGAILEHLLDREARLVAISLLPAGPATAERLLQTALADRPAATAGAGYVNLGYLPGKEAAVRLLGRRLSTVLPVDFAGNRVADLAVMDPIITLQSFDLILVLTSGQDDLRWWFEQAGAPYQVKLAAGVSASLEPLARPYYETAPRQLAGLIGGVPGAAIYSSLHRSDGAEGAAASSLPLERGMSARLDAQLAGHLVLILAILGGSMIQPMLAMVRRAIQRGR